MLLNLIMLQHYKTETKKDFTYDIAAVFTKYVDTVFALAYSKCNANYSDAWDITSEVFYRLTRKQPVFESDEHLKAWLLRVTVNCSNSLFTSHWHKSTVALPQNISYTTTMDEEDKTVYNAVLALPENLRNAIHLFYYEDMSIKQIAEIMRANENTVKSWLKRGREKLRSVLKEDIT